MGNDDFYEEDEPVYKLLDAYDRGEQGVTEPPQEQAEAGYYLVSYMAGPPHGATVLGTNDVFMVPPANLDQVGELQTAMTTKLVRDGKLPAGSRLAVLAWSLMDRENLIDVQP